MSVVSEPWRELFDLTTQAYYDGRYEAGAEACELLRSREDVPADIEDIVRKNQVFYTPALSALAASTRIVPLQVPVTPGWSRFNPSIASAPDGFRVIIRSSNYFAIRGKYDILGGDHTIQTVNLQVNLDPEFAIRRVVPITDQTKLSARFPSPAVGYEDCRLFRWGSDWFVAATTRESNPAATAQMVLLRLDDDGFHDVRFLSDPATVRDEKNWMPLVHHDVLRFVYSSS